MNHVLSFIANLAYALGLYTTSTMGRLRVPLVTHDDFHGHKDKLPKSHIFVVLFMDGSSSKYIVHYLIKFVILIWSLF